MANTKVVFRRRPERALRLLQPGAPAPPGGTCQSPTLVSSSASTWTGVDATDEVTGTITWSAGDLVIVVGVTDEGLGGKLLNTPTATGLTFTSIDSDTSTDGCAVFAWEATAAAAGSSAVTAAHTGGTSSGAGIKAFVYNGHGGVGATAKQVKVNADTLSLTRLDSASAVVLVSGDWAINAFDNGTTASSTVTPSTDGTKDFYTGGGSPDLTGSDLCCAHWTAQGAAGTTSYGFAGVGTTPDNSRRRSSIAVEILRGLTVTDRGTFQTSQGGALTFSITSASFSVAAGTILVVGIGNNARNNDLTGGSQTLVTAVSDNIGDTGGGTWTKRASCTRGPVVNGAYLEDSEIWTRVIGTSPGSSKTVTVSGQTSSAGVTNSADGWFAAHMWEVAGQHASPIGLTASPAPATSGTTFNTDFGSTPASTSAAFGIAQADHGSGTALTQPSGWTESDDLFPSGVNSYEWAYKIGSVVQSPQWSGFNGTERVLCCAVEIKAAVCAAAFSPPVRQIRRFVPISSKKAMS